jgi:hypothetical protein
MVTTLSSIGWRMTSRTRLPNSGNSSRNKTPRCASEISPGLGIFPPPTSQHVRLYDAANGMDDDELRLCLRGVDLQRNICELLPRILQCSFREECPVMLAPIMFCRLLDFHHQDVIDTLILIFLKRKASNISLKNPL